VWLTLVLCFVFPSFAGEQETQRLLAEPAPGISASPSEENARYFNVMIIGPTTSPYEGGVYKLELYLPEDYPMAAPKVRSRFRRTRRLVDPSDLCSVWLHVPLGLTRRVCSLSLSLLLLVLLRPSSPQVRFLTKIYHPNIDKLGRICLDILKDKWSPALQIRTVLLSIQALLSSPNPDDPLDENVARQWREDENAAIGIAKDWTRIYAMQDN